MKDVATSSQCAQYIFSRVVTKKRPIGVQDHGEMTAHPIVAADMLDDGALADLRATDKR